MYEIVKLVNFIHSFIHDGDLYRASSRLLLRIAPDPCTAKQNSFKARVKCVIHLYGFDVLQLIIQATRELVNS